jgi:hypothetical protein
MSARVIDVAADIAGLDALFKDDLAQRFRELYGRPPPRYVHRGLLLRAVAHRVQENAQGGPNPALRRRLARLADELRRTGRIAVGSRPLVKPGTRLLREWQGETHTVTVLENGFEYRGERHDSLSVIARAITGTRWSGPAFFGLRNGDRRGSDMVGAADEQA